MAQQYAPLEVKVWGDFACFTRPEMKVERVTYPVITPSAARGLLEAIFWKPEIRWRIREIHVLRPIRYISLLRNEVAGKASYRTARAAAGGWGGIVASEQRQQRHSLLLRDVAYLIRADVVLNPGIDESVAKYRDQFRRRVARGQCFHRPYLGCREFAAMFAEPDGSERAVVQSDDLGLMLFDMRFEEDGTATPLFFRASLDNGVLHVPQELYEGR